MMSVILATWLYCTPVFLAILLREDVRRVAAIERRRNEEARNVKTDNESQTGPWRRYIVTGDRHWYCADVTNRVIHGLLARHDNTFTIVHGDAPGVDAAFRETCQRLGVAHEPHPADWKAYGKGAGPRRNQAMVDAGALYAIAVHPDLANSKGTKDMVGRCLKAGIDVYLIDGMNPTRRITELPR